MVSSEMACEQARDITPKQLADEIGGGTATLLRVALSAAVPLAIERARTYPDWKFKERAQDAGNLIAEQGDVLQFGSKRKGQAGAVFNALAEGLALLAFRPGGVYFAGMHFEARRDDA